MAAESATLPFVDEHQVLVAAPAAAVWSQLGRAMRARPALAGRIAASLLGAQSRSAGGDPLMRGATLPGFTVSEAVPGSRLVLTGRHRFADHALVFVLSTRGGTTLLSARTHARFPGVRGRLYRGLVIGSRGHRVLVTRMLRNIRDAAESAAAS